MTDYRQAVRFMLKAGDPRDAASEKIRALIRLGHSLAGWPGGRLGLCQQYRKGALALLEVYGPPVLA